MLCATIATAAPRRAYAAARRAAGRAAPPAAASRSRGTRPRSRAARRYSFRRRYENSTTPSDTIGAPARQPQRRQAARAGCRADRATGCRAAAAPARSSPELRAHDARHQQHPRQRARSARAPRARGVPAPPVRGTPARRSRPAARAACSPLASQRSMLRVAPREAVVGSDVIARRVGGPQRGRCRRRHSLLDRAAARAPSPRAVPPPSSSSTSGTCIAGGERVRQPVQHDVQAAGASAPWRRVRVAAARAAACVETARRPAWSRGSSRCAATVERTPIMVTGCVPVLCSVRYAAATSLPGRGADPRIVTRERRRRGGARSAGRARGSDEQARREVSSGHPLRTGAERGGRGNYARRRLRATDYDASPSHARQRPHATLRSLPHWSRCSPARSRSAARGSSCACRRPGRPRPRSGAARSHCRSCCCGRCSSGAAARRPDSQRSVRDPLFLWAGVFFAGDLALWHWSLLLTSIAASTLEANCAPMLVTLFAWLLWGERPRLGFVLSLALAFAGMLLILAPKLGARQPRAGGRCAGPGHRVLLCRATSWWSRACARATTPASSCSPAPWCSPCCCCRSH